MAEINGGNFGEGMSTAAINKLLVAELEKKGVNGSDLRWASALLGVALDGTQGAAIADSATRNNALSKDDKDGFEERYAKCETEEEKQALIKEFLQKSGDQEGGLFDGAIYSIDSNGNIYVSDAPEMNAESFLELAEATGEALLIVGAIYGGAIAGEYIIVKLANGTVAKVAATPAVITGVVQSRINLMNGNSARGWEHVLQRHFNPSVNASQFTISQEECRVLLQSKEIITSPVVRKLYSETAGDVFIREVTLNQMIGIDKFTNQATNILTVMTDKYGNLVSTFPGVIK